VKKRKILFIIAYFTGVLLTCVMGCYGTFRDSILNKCIYFLDITVYNPNEHGNPNEKK